MIIQDLSVLKTKSRDTTVESCQLNNIFEKLETELNNSERKGIGLAAIQINSPIRACIIRITHENGKMCNLNMINPRIEKLETPMILQNEGCLSLPGVLIDTDRFAEIVCSWVDYDSKKEMRAYFSGIEALAIQHEVAHMSGLLITDFEHKKQDKIGRNDDCPECLKIGDKIKYKKCKLHFK